MDETLFELSLDGQEMPPPFALFDPGRRDHGRVGEQVVLGRAADRVDPGSRGSGRPHPRRARVDGSGCAGAGAVGRHPAAAAAARDFCRSGGLGWRLRRDALVAALRVRRCRRGGSGAGGWVVAVVRACLSRSAPAWWGSLSGTAYCWWPARDSPRMAGWSRSCGCPYTLEPDTLRDAVQRLATSYASLATGPPPPAARQRCSRSAGAVVRATDLAAARRPAYGAR